MLLGTVDKSGVQLRYNPNGGAVASFTLVLREVWSDGKAHAVLMPVEIVGKRAEQTASELEAGMLVLI